MARVGIIVCEGDVYVGINAYYVLFCYFNGSEWYHINISIHGIVILIFFHAQWLRTMYINTSALHWEVHLM